MAYSYIVKNGAAVPIRNGQSANTKFRIRAIISSLLVSRREIDRGFAIAGVFTEGLLYGLSLQEQTILLAA